MGLELLRIRLRVVGAGQALVTILVCGALFLSQMNLASARQFRSEKADFEIETITGGLLHPWGLAFLPDGRMLVTERGGKLRVVAPDAPKGERLSRPIKGVTLVAVRGQGGLLDVALDPDFANNRLVYLSFAQRRKSDRTGTAVVRAKLNDAATVLLNSEVIFRQQPSAGGVGHYGSRLVFADDGSLFVTTGDRFRHRSEAQNGANHLGKVIRILPDGAPPTDNPATEGMDWAPEIWSIGHRNLQGAALHPETRALWTIEHGAQGGDEVNRPQKGRNYGWPIITYGRDYSGAKIGVGTHKEGLEQPIHYWDPSIAPSGMMFYTGDKFPAWQGNLFVGALAGTALVRLELDGENVVHEERLLEELGSRIRDVRQGPNGLIYLLDDSNGRVLRLRPKKGG